MLLDIRSGANNSRTKASRGMLPAAISGPSELERNRRRNGGASRDIGLGAEASGKR
jgi:hypothetical protein